MSRSLRKFEDLLIPPNTLGFRNKIILISFSDFFRVTAIAQKIPPKILYGHVRYFRIILIILESSFDQSFLAGKDLDSQKKPKITKQQLIAIPTNALTARKELSKYPYKAEPSFPTTLAIIIEITIIKVNYSFNLSSGQKSQITAIPTLYIPKVIPLIRKTIGSI